MGSVRGLVGMGRVMGSGRRLYFVFISSHKDSKRVCGHACASSVLEMSDLLRWFSNTFICC